MESHHQHEPLERQGWTSTIYRLPHEPNKLCKAFDKDGGSRLYHVEKAAYERLSIHNPPSGILRYHGVHDSIPLGLVLEYAKNHDLDGYLWQQQQLEQPPPNSALLYRWAKQAAEALAFAHSLGVYNSDIHLVNFFLDEDLNLKVADWAGASIDGSKSYSSYRIEYRLRDADGKDVPRKTGITPATEVFALGTALFCMVQGRNQIWPELRDPEDKDEIVRRIAEREFPETKEILLGSVIERCWNGGFKSMNEVLLGIEEEEEKNEELVESIVRDARN